MLKGNKYFRTINRETMLYYLKYISHPVEKLQELLDFFFTAVENDNPTVFDNSVLFPSWYNAPSSNGSQQTMRNLETNLATFLHLDNPSKLKIIKAFREANEIPAIFFDKSKNIPVGKDFSESIILNEIFVKLYENQLSKRLQDNVPFLGKINSDFYDHYKKLREENIKHGSTFTVCPFCVIEPLKMIDTEGRPSYDHLLPKGNSLYIFSAVNMKNLVPIGEICNKLKDDAHLLYTDAARNIRTIAFYPYDNYPHPFELISINLECKDLPAFRTSGSWKVSITPKNQSDQILIAKIETWIRVFNIEERYANYIRDRSYDLVKNLADLYNKKENLSEEVRRKIDEDFRLTFSIIAIEEGVIPKRIFFEWALIEPNYLDTFITAKNIDPNPDNNVSIEDCEYWPIYL